MQVSSTPTSTDALIERKKILDENALLRQQHDILKRQCDELNIAKEEVRIELDKKYKSIDSATDIHKKVSKIIEDENTLLYTKNYNAYRVYLSKKENEEALIKSIEEKEKKASYITDRIESLQKEKDEIETLYKNLRQEHELKIESRKKELNDIETKTSDFKIILDADKKNHADKEQWIIAEESRLAQRASDIRIYEARIRKMATIAGIELNIIL